MVVTVPPSVGLEQAAPGGEALPVGSHQYCGVVVDDGPDAHTPGGMHVGSAARTRSCRASIASEDWVFVLGSED